MAKSEVRTERTTASDQPPDGRHGERQRGWEAGFLTGFHYQMDGHYSLLLQVID